MQIRPTPTTLRALLFAACMAATATPAVAQSPTGGPLPPVDDLVRYFDTIVFGSEMGPAYANKVIAKWEGTIGISLQALGTEQYAQFIQAHLRNLRKLTGLAFHQVDPKANVQGVSVIFVKRADMDKIPVPEQYRAPMKQAAAAGSCYFLSWKKPESRIVKAVVVVNVERDPALINSCLLEELTQSLGLPNDSDAMRPSIFSDRDHLSELSPHDAILVRALYDPRMTAGLPRAAALGVARTIISELVGSAGSSTSRGRGG